MSEFQSIFSKPRLSRLRISGVDIPPAADRDIKVSVQLIGDAADMRRTVNADLINVSRAIFRKYAISISASDLHVAGLAGLTPGDYVEVLLPDPIAVSPASPATVIELPRAGVDVIGITPDGHRVEPMAQPASPLPLHASRAPARVSALRIRPSVTFSEPVSLVRYRPALACAVVNWSIDTDERLAESSWSLELEEV